MKEIKEINLVLDMSIKRDKNIYNELKNFARKHRIDNESDALKSFMIYLHFIGADIKALDEKIKDLV